MKEITVKELTKKLNGEYDKESKNEWIVGYEDPVSLMCGNFNDDRWGKHMLIRNNREWSSYTLFASNEELTKQVKRVDCGILSNQETYDLFLG